MADLKRLVALSRRYGSDQEWVLAGGGNTSFKDASTLYVKASGTALGSIAEGGFCAIDRARLGAMWQASYPADAEAREAAALADLMAAREAGETKRPSVETLMHGLFPQAYVVHTHPAAINGITCGREGRAAFESLFGDEGIWVPFVDPGYILAKTVKAAMEEFRARKGRVPALMLMQNHGFLVAGESLEEIDALSSRAMALVLARVKRLPDQAARSADTREAAAAAEALSQLAGAEAAIRFRCDAETLSRAESAAAFAPLSSSFSPDHIVYAGHEFLRVAGVSGIEAAWADFEKRNGAPPRIVVVKGLGSFACAKSASAAETAMLLFTDACKVAAYAGGLSEEKVIQQQREINRLNESFAGIRVRSFY